MCGVLAADADQCSMQGKELEKRIKDLEDEIWDTKFGPFPPRSQCEKRGTELEKRVKELEDKIRKKLGPADWAASFFP